MGEVSSGEPALIACPSCGGLGLKSAPCACRHNGNTFMVTGGLLMSETEPYADCELCHGSGETEMMCFPCRQGGELRAQGVVTVVNAVTGQTASVQIVPGATEVVPWEPRPSRRIIDVAAIVRDLAGQVKVDVLFDMLDRPLTDDDLATPIFLPESWRDDAPAGERETAEQSAIAEWSGRRRWHLYVGYPAGVRARPEPARRLAELRAVADTARLDLVIRFAERAWSVAYEVPGSEARPGQATQNNGRTLPEALAAVTPADLVENAKTATSAKGYWVTSTPQPPEHASADWDVEELSRAVARSAERAAGGSATWRDGRWHVRPLVVVDSRELLSTQPTGQVRARKERITDRSDPLPEPSWQGTEIPTVRCARCVSGVAWRECSCTYLDDSPAPDCPRCSGAGRAPDPYCSGCDDTRMLHLGVVVTLVGTDGRGMVTNLRLAAAPKVTFFTNEHGVRCAQVPRELTAVAWAERFGTDPDWLCSHGIRSIGVLARDGIFATDLTDPRQVVAEYFARLTTGRPGGRLVYFVKPPGDAEIGALLRVVLGVDASLEVSIAADPRGGLRWGVAIAHRGQASRYAPPEVDLTLGDAIGRVMASLPQRLGAIEHDVTRTEALRPPQQAGVADLESGIEAMLREVAGKYDRVLARASRNGWTLHALTQRSWTTVGSGPTLRVAVTRARQN